MYRIIIIIIASKEKLTGDNTKTIGNGVEIEGVGGRRRKGAVQCGNPVGSCSNGIDNVSFIKSTEKPLPNK